MEKNIENLMKGLVGSLQQYNDAKNGDKNKTLRKITHPPITISRELGSGGRIIAAYISKRLNYHLYDKEIIEIISKESDVKAGLIEVLDEHRLSNVELWIQSLFQDKVIDEYEYGALLVKVIHSLAELGKVVILGRAANIILGAGGSLRVRVVAPIEMRIKNLIKYEKINEEEAKKQIIKSDKERSNFLKSYFNSDITNPFSYDMIINIENFKSLEAVGDLIIESLNKIKINK